MLSQLHLFFWTLFSTLILGLGFQGLWLKGLCSKGPFQVGNEGGYGQGARKWCIVDIQRGTVNFIFLLLEDESASGASSEGGPELYPERPDGVIIYGLSGRVQEIDNTLKPA
jgi:hypothetical protein